MNKEQIKYKVKEIVTRHLGCPDEDATDTANFKDDLGADSLDCVELFMEVEREFSTTIPDPEQPELVTIEALTNFLHERLAYV